MRRRRKRRETMGVSLFPFLAVLICTLGVLIVMLVMAVKAADDTATEQVVAAQEVQQQTLNDLQSALEVRELQIAAISSVRPDAVSHLADARTQRGYLEEEIRQLKERSSQMGETLLGLATALLSSADETNMDNRLDDSDLANLESRILGAQEALKAKRAESQIEGPVTYSIVPHAGGGGTFRRPIYVECSDESLVIQPLGIRLEKSEFVPPLQNGNMLDAALLAVREYWDRYDLNGTEGSAYPLLVVRPDGAETYMLARRAMRSWDDEFGYELVEADKALDFGSPDPQLVEVVTEAVDQARRRQSRVLAQRRSVGDRLADGNSGRNSNGSFHEAGDQAPGLTASSQQGGFVSNTDWKTSSNAALRNVEQTGGVEGSGDSNSFSSDPSTRNTNTDLGSQANHSGESNDFNKSNERANDERATAGGTQSMPNASGQQGDLQSPYQSLSLAAERGENWALPTQTPGATGYVRPIRLYCSADELELRSALGTERKFPIQGDIENAVDPLVNEIWRKIESWGVAGNRGYWKPELRISVLPGGELNFEKLQGLLYDSGLIVKGSAP